MFFALTDDQREFGAAVRGYLADRFDLAAVRGVVEDRDGDGNPATLWKAAGEQGWLAVTRARGARRPRARPGRGPGHRPRARRGRGAGAVARHRARRRGDPAGRVGRAAGDLAAPAGRGRRGRRARGPRPRARDVCRPSSTAAIADVVVAPPADGPHLVERVDRTPRGRYDGTVRLADVAGGAGDGAARRHRGGRAELAARAAVLVGRRPGRASPARRSPARSPTTASASSSACRSARSRRSSTRWPTCTSRSPWPSTPRSTPRTPSTSGADDAALAVAVAKAKAGDAAVAATAAMIQYHGGIGYTWEHEAHLFYKRAKRLAGQCGGATPTAPGSPS